MSIYPRRGKNIKQANVNIKAWCWLEKEFPHLSSSERSIIAVKSVRLLDINSKLRPEVTDTKKDKVLKEMLKGDFFKKWKE